MDIFSEVDVLKNKRRVVERIRKGEVFIYPTDTIYGIGCDATNQGAVERVRDVKEREGKPFSVIPPSLDWVKKNCQLSKAAEKWLVKLPGPYTLVLPLANPECVAPSTNKGLNSVGVRLPEHWFSGVVEALGRPVVTTSVNRAGMAPATRLDQFEKFPVDFVVYEGEKAGRPSTVVDLTAGERIKKR